MAAGRTMCFALIALLAGCAGEDEPPTEVPPSLVMSSNSAGLWLFQASTDSAVAMVELTSDGAAIEGLAVTVTGAPPWLTVTLSTTLTPSVLRLAARALALPPGAHEALVTISADDPRIESQVVTVTLGIEEPATLDVNPDSLLLDATVGGTPPGGSVAITALDFDEVDRLTATITYLGAARDWLAVTFDATATPTMLRLVTAPGALPEGEHRAEVTIQAPGAHTETLPVRLTLRDTRATVRFIRAGDFFYDLSPGSGTVSGVGFSCNVTAPDCSVRAAAGASLTFTATPDALNQFIEWVGPACPNVGFPRETTCTITVLGDTTVGMNFSLLGYGVSVTLQGDGADGEVYPSGSSWVTPIPCLLTAGVQLEPCSRYQGMGARTVSLFPRPLPGSICVGWSGECTVDGAYCILTPNPGGGRSAVATFARSP